MNAVLRLCLTCGQAATIRSNGICKKHALIKMFCNNNFKKLSTLA